MFGEVGPGGVLGEVEQYSASGSHGIARSLIALRPQARSTDGVFSYRATGPAGSSWLARD